MRIFSLAVAQAQGYTYSMLLPRKPKSKKKRKRKRNENENRQACHECLTSENKLLAAFAPAQTYCTSIWTNVPGSLEDALAIIIVTGKDM